MPTSYTSLLGLALPVTGELSGTWGDVVNTEITDLLDSAIAGYATADVTSGDWTLSTTGSGLPNEARMAIIIPTGTPGVVRNVIAPSQSKIYIVINQSDSNIVFKGAATTGVTVYAGANAVVAWNGSDFAVTGGGSQISNDTSTSSYEYPLFAAATSGTATNVYTSNAKLRYKPSTGEFQIGRAHV